jgi:hypothetical protein
MQNYREENQITGYLIKVRGQRTSLTTKGNWGGWGYVMILVPYSNDTF